jgi:hypothetical protein
MSAVLLATVIAVPATTVAQGTEKTPKAPPAGSPLRKDKTGMKWVLPFPTALAYAKQMKRVLMIKPVAFGTEKSGGW